MFLVVDEVVPLIDDLEYASIHPSDAASSLYQVTTDSTVGSVKLTEPEKEKLNLRCANWPPVHTRNDDVCATRETTKITPSINCKRFLSKLSQIKIDFHK